MQCAGNSVRLREWCLPRFEFGSCQKEDIPIHETQAIGGREPLILMNIPVPGRVSDRQIGTIFVFIY